MVYICKVLGHTHISLHFCPEAVSSPINTLLIHSWVTSRVTHGWQWTANELVQNPATYSKLNLCQKLREIQRYVKDNCCLEGDFFLPLWNTYSYPNLHIYPCFSSWTFQLPNNYPSHMFPKLCQTSSANEQSWLQYSPVLSKSVTCSMTWTSLQSAHL